MRPNVFLKNALAVLIPAGLLLTGCTAAEKETAFSPHLTDSYTVQAEMTYTDGGTASLKLTRTQAEQWEAEFSEPASLSGMVLSFDGNAVSASYKGLAFTVPKSALPAKNMLVMVTEIMDAVGSQKEIPCKKQDDGTWTGSGDCSGGSYTVTFSGSGEPVALEIPSQPLYIQFTEYAACTVTEPASDTESAQTETTTSAADTTKEGTSQ
ncbi:MAG: hypothetical protein IKI58_09350 [Oscillospiraceae bacterium]|nr:hypothetical protein [Oscillospiraceae bacterium]